MATIGRRLSSNPNSLETSVSGKLHPNADRSIWQKQENPPDSARHFICQPPPEFWNEGHGEALVLADDPKRFAESLQGKIVVEASEMAGLARANLERLKANVSRRNDGSVRLAYRRNPEPMPRRAIFFGTSNDDECLPNDATGNRRFVVVELQGDRARMQVEDYMAEHRDELWSAAAYEYLHKEQRANLPYELKAAQTEHNERYRRGDMIVEDQLAAAKFGDTALDPGMTIREITHRMFTDSNEADQMLRQSFWANRLGKALTSQGWERRRASASGKRQSLWRCPTGEGGRGGRVST